jgi:uncharacterized DUF497 family protein
MRIVWDSKKARTNFRKHGVRFSDAEGVLFDPRAVSQEDKAARGEERYISLGMDHLGRILVIVYAYGKNEIRIISARRATRREREEYAKGVRF